MHIGHDEIQAIVLSVKAAAFSTILSCPFALVLGWLLARKKFIGKPLAEGLLNIPLVLPPVITGYLLLLMFGQKGVIGHFLYSSFGIRIPFTFAAVIIASMVVSFPLYLKSIQTSFEMSDASLEKVARSLGAGRLKVFFTVSVPLAKPGIISGTILCFARCLGEFGATITLAGNMKGLTRTIPLAVYSYMHIPGKEKQSVTLVLFSVIISILAIMLSGHFNKLRRKKA